MADESPWSVAAQVLAVVEGHMNDACRPALSRSAVIAGGLIMDTCCRVLSVGVVDEYPATTPFPTLVGSQGAAETCGDLIAVEFVITMSSCFPTPDDGTAPDYAAEAAAYREVYEDAAAIWNAIYSDDMTKDGEWLIGGRARAYGGPEGGCIWSETRITVGLDQTVYCIGCVADDEGDPPP